MSTIKLGSADTDYFNKYDRKFIQLNRNTAMLIHLFEKDSDHSWEDIWLQDLTGIYEKDMLLYKEAAEQFVNQLEGQLCIAFLEALRDECNKHIEDHKENIKKYENKN